MGRIAKATSHGLTFTSNQILSYGNTFANDHTVDAFVAHEVSYTKSYSMTGYKNFLARPDDLELGNAIEMSYISSGSGELSLESYFAQARYNYKERYFVHGTVRADGSSRFARGHRWGTFGAIGVAWLMSNEDFMSSASIIRNLKLKASWGVLGNQDIGSYLYTNQYSISNVDGSVGYTLGYIGNPDLTWESSSNFNAGFELTLGKYLDLEAEYFFKQTTNMLFPRYVAPSMGYSYYYVNEGALANQGVEFQANIHAVNTKAVTLDIRLNGAYYENKVTEMPKDNSGNYMDMNGGYSLGHSLYDYYMTEFAGVDPESGKALYTYFYDPNNLVGDEFQLNYDAILSVHQYIIDNYKDDPRYQEYLKNPELILEKGTTDNAAYASNFYVGKQASPKLQGGFGFDLGFYGFDLSASFQYSLGGYGMDYSYATLMHSGRGGETNWHVDILDRWQNPGDVTDVPRLSNGNDLYANESSTRFLISSNYLTLSNVRLGYSFPKKWMEKIHLNNLNIWVAGDNLFCLSARKGYIPMASMTGSSSTYQYTPLSTIMGGIKFSF